eukprot:2092084-Pyramimonas_sp.AAC.1
MWGGEGESSEASIVSGSEAGDRGDDRGDPSGADDDAGYLHHHTDGPEHYSQPQVSKTASKPQVNRK